MTSEWISVEERLPEEEPGIWSDDCLVVDASGLMWIGQLFGREWFDEVGEDRIERVTHWMPLPEPPEVSE